MANIVCLNRKISPSFTKSRRSLTIALLSIFSTAFLVNQVVLAESATEPTGFAPGSAPASAATTAPRKLIIPDGFKAVVVNRRSAICPAADETWVHDALAQAGAGTQPSTRPADLLAHLKDQQDQFETNLSSSLALPDKQVTVDFVNQRLLPLVSQLGRMRVQVVYLVATQDELKALVRAGWDSAQFHYDEANDKVTFNGSMVVSPDGVDGESILPKIYQAGESTESRVARLGAEVSQTEATVEAMIARQSLSAVQVEIANFISRSTLKPLKLNLSQDWFAAGVSSYYSTFFVAELSGANAVDLIRRMGHPDPRNPVASTAIDMLRPTNPSLLKPDEVGAYGDAFRRRSLAIVSSLIDRAGPDAVSKTIAAIRANPPADGPALVSLVQKCTGVDLSSDLAPE